MATPDMILVKNQTSFWMVVSLNLVSPDMATTRPMIDLSPIAKTTPVHVPWTTKVEVRARLRLSNGFWEVESTVPGTISLEILINELERVKGFKSPLPLSGQKRTVKFEVCRSLHYPEVSR